MTTKKVITNENLDEQTLEVNSSHKLTVKVGTTLKTTTAGLDLADELKTKLDEVDTLKTTVAGKADTTTVEDLKQKVTTLEANPAGISDDKFTVELQDLAGNSIGKVYVQSK